MTVSGKPMYWRREVNALAVESHRVWALERQMILLTSWTNWVVHFYRSMPSLERIVAVLPWCSSVRLSVCLSVWDGHALWSYGAR